MIKEYLSDGELEWMDKLVAEYKAINYLGRDPKYLEASVFHFNLFNMPEIDEICPESELVLELDRNMEVNTEQTGG